jgi:Glycosyl hydrolases family 39
MPLTPNNRPGKVVNRGAALLLILAFCLATAGAQAMSARKSVPVRLDPPSGPIPGTFFGMHIHYFATSTPWPSVSFGSLRLWDAYVTWPRIEPKQGTWDFTGLDKYVDAASQQNIDVVLPLGLSPSWVSSRPEEKSAYGPGNASNPARLDAWRDYVRMVVTRYKGRILAYEIWNEPNLKQFYSGSVSEMLQLAGAAYTIIKEIDPQAVVCSPSATNQDGVKWLDQYLQQGGGKYADVIGFHFYANPEPPETMLPLIGQVKAVLQKHNLGNKPLWNTETGWAIQNSLSVVRAAPASTRFNSIVLSQEQASAYLARTHILNWAESIQCLYWYSWDNKVMGLTEADGKTVKKPARAYAEVRKWLVGAWMKSCDASVDGTWTCQIARENGYQGWIVWNPDLTLEFRIPATWRVRSVHELQGQQRLIAVDRPVRVGADPVLFDNSVP